MNRGIARRAVFETRADVRAFLCLLAVAVRRRKIEVIAFCFLTTHFHLVLRSLDGHLSETLRWVLNVYVRWFNRRRRRDGPLFRGRFRSVPVPSARQLWHVIRYVDRNPVDAHLAPSPFEYPHASARLHAATTKRPPWLEGSIVDRALGPLLREGRDRRTAYELAFPSCLSPEVKAFVERRLRHARPWLPVENPIDAADGPLLAWMTRKARSADGTRPGMPLVLRSEVEAAVGRRATELAGSSVPSGASASIPAATAVRATLLRRLAGERLVDVASALGMSPSSVVRMEAAHARVLRADERHRRIVLSLVRELLADERTAHAGLPFAHDVEGLAPS